MIDVMSGMPQPLGGQSEPGVRRQFLLFAPGVLIGRPG
jgi:hypothetical protein